MDLRLHGTGESYHHWATVAFQISHLALMIELRRVPLAVTGSHCSLSSLYSPVPFKQSEVIEFNAVMDGIRNGIEGECLSPGSLASTQLVAD